VSQTLSPPQKTWLEGLLGIKAVQPAVETLDPAHVQGELDQQQRKEDLLAAATAAIESSVGEIEVGEDFYLKMKSGGLAEFLKGRANKSFEIASIGDKGNANKEFDTFHDLPKVDGKGMDGQIFARLMNAQSVVATESAKLRNAYNLDTRQPLFTDKEISDAIWAPLMRRKLIPENAIPDRYSEVSRTFEGASVSYQERLASYTDGLGKFDTVCQRLGVGKDTLDGIATVATSTIETLVGLKIDNFDPALATDCITLVNVTLSGSIGATQEILNLSQQDDIPFGMKVAKAAVAIGKQAVGIGAAAATLGYSNQGDLGADIAAIIKDSLNMGVSAGSALVNLKNGDYEKALNDVADIVATAMATAGSVGNSKTDSKDYTYSDKPPTAKVSLSELGIFIADIIRTGPAAKNFLQKMKAGTVKIEDVGKLLGVVMQQAVAASSKYYLDKSNSQKEFKAETKDHNAGEDDQRPEYKYVTMVEEPNFAQLQSEGSSSQGFSSIGQVMQLLQSKSGKELEELLKTNPEYKELAERLKEQQKSVIDDAEENMDKQVAVEAKAFRDMINRGQNGDLETQARTVEAMILQIKRDQMLTDLALKLTSMPAQVIAAFLPQAGIAVSGIELIKNFKLVLQHFQAYLEWKENVGDAQSAMSVQAEAMINRAGLEATQTLQATAEAISAAINIVGGALACAGPLAPVGHVVASVNKATHAIASVLYKFHSKKQLQSQWKLHLAALDEPRDRITVRQAIRENPTLAKYVIAYGAQEENNPIARNAMRKCGLNAEVLDKQGTNVGKVEAYLEALYPEDPVVLAPVSRPKTWWPGRLELTAAAVAAFVAAAETEAKPKLKAGQGDRLINALAEIEVLKKQYETTFRAWRDKEADYEKIEEEDRKPADLDPVTAELTALDIVARRRSETADGILLELKAGDWVDDKSAPHKEMNDVLLALLTPARGLVASYRQAFEFAEQQLIVLEKAKEELKKRAEEKGKEGKEDN
jgi:hypothetical protein